MPNSTRGGEGKRAGLYWVFRARIYRLRSDFRSVSDIYGRAHVLRSTTSDCALGLQIYPDIPKSVREFMRMEGVRNLREYLIVCMVGLESGDL